MNWVELGRRIELEIGSLNIIHHHTHADGMARYGPLSAPNDTKCLPALNPCNSRVRSNLKIFVSPSMFWPVRAGEYTRSIKHRGACLLTLVRHSHPPRAYCSSLQSRRDWMRFKESYKEYSFVPGPQTPDLLRNHPAPKTHPTADLRTCGP